MALKACWHCKHPLQSAKTECPSCGAWTQEKTMELLSPRDAQIVMEYGLLIQTPALMAAGGTQLLEHESLMARLADFGAPELDRHSELACAVFKGFCLWHAFAMARKQQGKAEIILAQLRSRLLTSTVARLREKYPDASSSDCLVCEGRRLWEKLDAIVEETQEEERGSPLMGTKWAEAVLGSTHILSGFPLHLEFTLTTTKLGTVAAQRFFLIPESLDPYLGVCRR